MLNLLAAFVIILKLPFLFLGFLFKHRIIFVVIIVAVIGIAAYRTIHKTQPEAANQVTIPYYQQIEPSKAQAPYVVQTVSPQRVYYATVVQDDGKTVILAANDFFMYNKGKWEIGKLPLYLDRANYKEIKIYQR